MSEQPNYVLHANEGVLEVVEKPSKWLVLLKYIVWIILALIIILSLIVEDNILGDLSTSNKLFLAGILIYLTFFLEKEEFRPSPMEIRFYDDYLEIYRPKKRVTKRSVRRSLHKMKYSGISKVVYRKDRDSILIYGDGDTKWWDYRKDGSLPDEPDDHRIYKDGLVFFNISQDPSVDFIKEIEDHSPLVVIPE